MGSAWHWVWVTVIVSVVVTIGCGGDDGKDEEDEEKCVVGQTEPCVCSTVRSGARVCSVDGTFGDCECTVGTGGAGGTPPVAGETGAGEGGSDVPPPPGGAGGDVPPPPGGTGGDVPPPPPGGEGGSAPCPEGAQGCPCYGNQTCNAGLVCSSNVCVPETPTGGAGATGGTGGDANAPVFLSLTTNTTVLGNRDTLTFSAVLTDPDGVEDLIGGSLKTPDGAASYGTFATSASEGAYSMSLSWSEINLVQPINASPVGIDRTFRAEFYDVAGNMVWQDVNVTLRCEFGDSACDGRCVETWRDSLDCGSCGHSCPSVAWTSDFASCREYRCYWLSDPISSRRSCDDFCASVGLVCIDHTDTGDESTSTGSGRYELDGEFTLPIDLCADVPPSTLVDASFVDMECYCGEPLPDWYDEYRAISS